MQESYTIAYKGKMDESYCGVLFGICRLGMRKPKDDTIETHSFYLERAKHGVQLLGFLSIILTLMLLFMKAHSIAESLHTVFVIVICISVALCLINAFLWWAERYNYEKFCKAICNRSTQGSLHIDENGISDETANGELTRRNWEQYDCCIITPTVLMIRCHSGIFFHLPSTDVLAQSVCNALKSFGYGDTIHICKVRL